MKYAELIVKTKEQKDSALAAPRAAEQKAKLGLEIGQLDLEIQTKNNTLEGLKGAYPVDFGAIVKAGDELALAKRRLQQLKDLDTELFSS